METHPKKTRHVYSVSLRQKRTLLRLFHLRCHWLASLMMCTQVFLIDIISPSRLKESTQDTDQKMETPSFKFGVRTSSIWVMILDVTLVPEVQKPIISMTTTSGAGQLRVMSWTSRCHFQCPLTDNRTLCKRSLTGIIMTRKSRK